MFTSLEWREINLRTMWSSGIFIHHNIVNPIIYQFILTIFYSSIHLSVHPYNLLFIHSFISSSLQSYIHPFIIRFFFCMQFFYIYCQLFIHFSSLISIISHRNILSCVSTIETGRLKSVTRPLLLFWPFQSTLCENLNINIKII